MVRPRLGVSIGVAFGAVAVVVAIVLLARGGGDRAVIGLPFADASRGVVRVCALAQLRVARASVSCAPGGGGGVAIRGLPHGVRLDDLAVAEVGAVSGVVDYAISDATASFDGRADAGLTWIVSASAAAHGIDLRRLGDIGFEIGGAAAGDRASVGHQVGLGSIDGSGLDSVVLTDQSAPSGVTRDSETAWVVFGARSGATVDLAHLGARGFEIRARPDGGSIEQATILGDVNGDGRADLGVVDAAKLGVDAVVFGERSSATVSLASLGTRGFLITGLAPAVGGPIAGAGDQTGDGIGDILVGNPWSGGQCGPDSPILAQICPGTAYLIYGARAGANVDVNSLGSRGYVITSASGATDGLGATVASTTGGGRSDLLIGESSHVFVVFARGSATPRTRTLDVDHRGFSFEIDFPVGSGIALGPGDGPGLSGIGDGDILLWPATPNGDGVANYVVYARTSTGALDVARLAGAGFQIR